MAPSFSFDKNTKVKQIRDEYRSHVSGIRHISKTIVSLNGLKINTRYAQVYKVELSVIISKTQISGI